MRELASMQYRASMGEEKVRLILLAHKAKMQQMVLKSLDKGWNTWSTQAVELQLLRAYHDDRKK